MPLNQIKTYNQQLELEHYNIEERENTLIKIFKRDIEDFNLFFRDKRVFPNKLEDHETTMQTLYNHLTKKVYDSDSYSREFDPFRSRRLHWVKDHIHETYKDSLIFSSIVRNTKKKRDENRIFILNEKEGYVVVLAPYRDQTAYYLLTAYYMRGGETSSIKSKYNRREKNMF